MKRKLTKKNKKKRGFTLIELLAVILILGIIALIAIPTVNNVIEQSRKGAYENTIDNIIKAAEQYAMMQELNSNNQLNGVYQYSVLKDSLDLKGNYDTNGYIEFINGEVVNYSFSNGKYVVRNGESEKEVITVSNNEVTMKNVYPYSEEYKDLIVNAYITYGKVPSNIPSNHIWSMSDNDEIKAYITPNYQDDSKYDLYIVSYDKILAHKNSQKLFYEYSSLKNVVFDNFDTKNTQRFDSFFQNDTLLESANVEKFNLSSAVNITNMFTNCSSLRKIDTSKWKTGKLSSASTVFGSCSSVEYLDVSGFDVSGVQSLSWTFSGCTSLTTIVGLENWNTESATVFSGLFNSTPLSSLNISNWKTNAVTNFKQMFYGMSNLTELDLSGWDTSSALNTESMFYKNLNLNVIYVGSGWNMNNVQTSEKMFYKCSKLRNFNSSYVDVGKANTDADGYLTNK